MNKQKVPLGIKVIIGFFIFEHCRMDNRARWSGDRL